MKAASQIHLNIGSYKLHGGIDMPSPYLVELALRSAVNTNNRELTNNGTQAEAIQTSALRRAQELQSLNSNSTASDYRISETTAIKMAVAGLVIAYTTISKQLDVIKNQRLSFDKERQAGIATFIIPINKEEVNLSREEKVIKEFLDLSSQYPSFLSYLGIHSANTLNNNKVKFYSILPFYKMSEAFNITTTTSKPLDRQRGSINLFFKSSLLDAIAKIENSFQTDWKIPAFCKSIIEKKNYLNNRRAPRFIMMALANLLWNLQHPVNPHSGFPLCTQDCIKLCQDVEAFLNQLLNSDATPYIHQISHDENDLLSFTHRIETHTKALKSAYIDEQLNELNIEEISNAAHDALRIMDTNIFKLIYKHYNQASQKEEPDEKATTTIADNINYLNRLLTINGDLTELFCPIPSWISPLAKMNTPPKTIVDLIILYCHLSYEERNALLTKISQQKSDSALEFAKTLSEFNRKFITPIEHLSKVELNSTVFLPKHQAVSRLTARRLIPLLTLVMKDYQTELDTPLTLSLSIKSKQGLIASETVSGKEQVELINACAERGEDYYIWSLSPFITMSLNVSSKIDDLPRRQYRITQLTELLDGLCFLIKNYRNFLQNKLFQSFVLKSLSKMKQEFASLNRHIDQIDKYFGQEERMSRKLQSILGPMMKDLNTSLETFALVATQLERVISAPNFTEHERQILASKLGQISVQYSKLFAEESGIESLIDIPIIPLPPIESIPMDPRIRNPDRITVRQAIALKRLVQHCYSALSYKSKEGNKGLLLQELLDYIEKNSKITENQIKHILLELTRITASYRETLIFQASYGQSRSARALIEAIKDPILNRTLPLAAIILGQRNPDILELSDAQILHHLRNLREGNFWPESCSQMRLELRSD